MERKGCYSDPLKSGPNKDREERVALILEMSILFSFVFFFPLFFSIKGKSVGVGCTVACWKYRILNLPLE